MSAMVRTWSGWSGNFWPPFGHRGSRNDREGIGSRIIVLGVVGLSLVGVIVFLSIQDARDPRTPVIYEAIEATNTLPETISIWSEVDGTRPNVGSAKSNYPWIKCTGSSCNVPRDAAVSWLVSTYPNDPDALFTVAAWLADSGEIVYAETFTAGELESAGWRLQITDHR